MLTLLAGELGRLPNELVIEGHTDSHPYRYSDLYGYGNWELSVDRANAARRCMQGAGRGPAPGGAGCAATRIGTCWRQTTLQQPQPAGFGGVGYQAAAASK